MKVKIEIDCDNAAFGDGADAGDELSRILNRLAGRVQLLGEIELQEWDGLPLRDINGNRVGRVEVEA